jgi:glycosyltransferase involved in cell wall biosynthesis
MSRPVAALIATRDREDLLLGRSVPSVLLQSSKPNVLVVVDDGHLREDAGEALRGQAQAHGVPIQLVQNRRARGAAGAWNTGLAHLAALGHSGFVAFLDDDDTWDPDHLQVNVTSAEGANIVVSGLRMRVGGRELPRALIEHLDDRAFLTGNPGWQGSNTFVDLALLLAVGGFREGLASLNDRDLAIRLLRHPSARWRVTGRWTATWNLDTPGNLSTPGSTAKRSGLRAFWRLSGAEMTTEERTAYFERAERLFGCLEADITATEDEALPAPARWEF